MASVHQPPTGRFFCAILSAVQKNTMTITERNQKLYQLRQDLAAAKAKAAWLEQEIWLVNAQYDRENRETPLFDEVFGG